ncbi:MAG: hypothetical protein ACRDVC_02205 [Acidimicrobiales bacterium]
MDSKSLRALIGARSKVRSVLGVGVASLLLLAGVGTVAALPASAATAASLSFTPTPPPTTTVAGVALSNFDVTVGAGGASGDTITVSSSCTLTGSTSKKFDGTNPVTFSGIAITDAKGGTCTLVAKDTTASGGRSVTSGSISVTPAAAAKLAYTPSPTSPAAADTGISIKVSSEDQYGNVVRTGAGSNDAITISSPCTLGGTTTATEVAGVATFSALSISTEGTCPLTAADRTITALNPVTADVDVTAGAPAKIVFTTAPPSSMLAVGTLATFRVSIEDANGIVVTSGAGSTDSVTITSPCTLSGALTERADAGVATFNDVSVGELNSCVLTATDVSRTLPSTTASTNVGEHQSALSITTKSGYLDTPLTLATRGGSGNGAISYSVTNGTATDCAITNGVLTAKTGGTCVVTATKASASPYDSASTTLTVQISSAPKALRLRGTVLRDATRTVTISGFNFFGRPRIVSNVAGFHARTARDSGRLLTIVVTVRGRTRPGVKTMTIILANGMRTSLRYSLRV